MLAVVGCKLSASHRPGRGQGGTGTGHRVQARDNDQEYYQNVFNFEELFLGHLKIISSQEEEEQDKTCGRLSPLIKLKLKPRTQ